MCHSSVLEGWVAVGTFRGLHKYTISLFLFFFTWFYVNIFNQCVEIELKCAFQFTVVLSAVNIYISITVLTFLIQYKDTENFGTEFTGISSLHLWVQVFTLFYLKILLLIVFHGMKNVEADPGTQSYITLPKVNSSNFLNCFFSVHAPLKCMLGPTVSFSSLEEILWAKENLLSNSMPEGFAHFYPYQSIVLQPHFFWIALAWGSVWLF